MKRQYWTDPENIEVEVDVVPIGGNDVMVVPVIFHPDEGGQPPDKGQIGDAKIEAVGIVDGKVCVTLDKCLPQGKYLAKVDASHRRDMASQHTGQHIISAVCETKYKNSTHGFHIGEITCTIDLKQPVTWEQLEDIETLANDYVMKDIPVETVFDKTDNLRIREDLTDGQFEVLRVVKIGDLDCSACCGTHVTSTGKVGPIIIMGLESHKGGSRLTYVAGQRAVKFTQKNSRVIRELRNICTSSTEELPAAVGKFANQVSVANKEIAQLWEKLLPGEIECAQIIEKDNEKYAMLLTTAPTKLHGKMSSMLSEKIGGTSIIVEDADLPQITIGSKTSKAKDLAARLFEKFGGKGGGSPISASGKLGKRAAADDIAQAI